MSEPITLPWRITGLDGFTTSHGYTYNGGAFSGGGPHSPQSIAVRMLSEYGRPATVQLDLCDDRGGRSVSLNPELARQAAAALLVAADKADADIQHWRDVLDQQREQLLAARHRDMVGRAGLSEDPEVTA